MGGHVGGEVARQGSAVAGLEAHRDGSGGLGGGGGGGDVDSLDALPPLVHGDGFEGQLQGEDQTTPWAIMARATFMKPATLAPRT